MKRVWAQMPLHGDPRYPHHANGRSVESPSGCYFARSLAEMREYPRWASRGIEPTSYRTATARHAGS